MQNTVTDEDAANIRTWYADRVVPPPCVSGVPAPTSVVVYVLQPIPEFKPTRFKVGVSDSLASRLKEYKTIYPSLAVRRLYDASFSHETVIHQLMSRRSVRVGPELFDVNDVDETLALIDQFFSFLGVEPSFKA